MRIVIATVLCAALLAAAPAPAEADRPFWGRNFGHHHHGHHHGHFHHRHFHPRSVGFSNFSIGFGYGSPFFGGYSFPFSYGYYRPRTSYYFGGYDPYCSRGYGYTSPGVIYYRPSDAYLDYQLPAVYAPAELAYGPQAVNQFLGVDRRLGLGDLIGRQPQLIGAADNDRALLDKLVNLVDGGLAGEGVVKPKFTPPPASSPAARQRAAHFMQSGDVSFRGAKPHEALQRYKQASAAAPDLAEAFFRQGHALAATNRFELAAEAFKRALALDPDPARDGFALDDLYGGALAKKSDLETLAGEALDNPHDSDLFFVLGVTLHYDGSPDRAQKFFQRAAELTTDREHLRKFLPDVDDIKPAENPAPVLQTAGLAT